MSYYLSSAIDYSKATLDFLGSLYNNTFPGKSYYSPDSMPNLEGKVFVVTGGLRGIGFHLTTFLASKGAKVYSLSRNAAHSRAAINTIHEHHPGAQIEYVAIDFNDLSTVAPAAKHLLAQEPEIHGIVHNSGIFPDKDTPDDVVFRINVLGPHLLQKYLDSVLIATAKKHPNQTDQFRIVWVSSFLHYTSLASGGVDFDHLLKGTPLTNYKMLRDAASYSHSKAANIFDSIQWAKRHPDSGVLSVSLHPGALRTEINPVGSPVAKLIEKTGYDPVYGAYTELYALLSSEITSAHNGAHIVPFGRIGKIRADIERAAKGPEGDRFWEYVEKQIKDF
jgi:protochlorophyllide reductase